MLFPREEAESRAEELVRSWLGTTDRNDAGASLLSDVLHYLPYFLATIYYSTGLVGQVRAHRKTPARSGDSSELLQECVEQVLHLAPPNTIARAQCFEDVDALIVELLSTESDKELSAAADAMSARLFKSLRKHVSDASEREMNLISYIVDEELKRVTKNQV